MELVKAGDPNKRVAEQNETIDVICKHCGAEMKLFPKDLDYRGGFIIKLKYVYRCIECHTLNTLTPDQLPAGFRRRVNMEINNANFWG